MIEIREKHQFGKHIMLCNIVPHIINNSNNNNKNR